MTESSTDNREYCVTDDGRYEVLIVAGDPLARAGLAGLIASSPLVRVAGELRALDDVDDDDLAEAVDVIIWDPGFTRAPGFAELDELPQRSAPVIVLVADESDGHDASRAGARGVLSRGASRDALIGAIVATASGLVVFEQKLAPVIEAIGDGVVSIDGISLTPRELEVIRLLAEGLPNKLIADRLGISDHTVKFHVNAILSKLGAHSRTEAVTRAARGGLITL
ncbi:MAG: response regulator transcription factor [bacterium]|nr:response regulator transcription factor [Candidatus Kapabacteria bacterium]